MVKRNHRLKLSHIHLQLVSDIPKIKIQTVVIEQRKHKRYMKHLNSSSQENKLLTMFLYLTLLFHEQDHKFYQRKYSILLMSCNNTYDQQMKQLKDSLLIKTKTNRTA